MKLSLLKKQLKPEVFLLAILLFIAADLLITILPSYFRPLYVIPIKSSSSSLPHATEVYVVKDAMATGDLWFKSDRFLDYFMVDKSTTIGIVSLLLLVLILVQLLRINLMWHSQNFTGKLYQNIDSLTVIGSISFLYSRIQAYYLNERLHELTKHALTFDDNYIVLTVSASIALFGVLLKAFAKRGNQLQVEQALTI